MMKKEKLEYGKIYHIYNKGNNHEDIFSTIENYKHFLNLYDNYITPVADTFAWCLMKNHFHFLVRIKELDEIPLMTPETFRTGQTKKPNVIYTEKKYKPVNQFMHLCNAYAQDYNNRVDRCGTLFNASFGRKLIDNYQYFKRAVYYIHYNPVRHGFVKNMMDYPWSSYLTMISFKPTKIKRDVVIGWFNTVNEFIEYHNTKQDIGNIEKYLFE
jgi:REP element-mobilizing transposase RayT